MNKTLVTIPLFLGYSPRAYTAENKSIPNLCRGCSVLTLTHRALHLPLLTCSASRIINTLAAQPTHVRAQGKAKREKIITPSVRYLRALCLVGGCGSTDEPCDALAKPRASPDSLLQRCFISRCFVGSQQGRSKPS